MDEKKQSIGALWKRTSAKGQDYYTGNIKINNEEVQIVVFENKTENEKAPVMRIFKNEKNRKED